MVQCFIQASTSRMSTTCCTEASSSVLTEHESLIEVTEAEEEALSDVCASWENRK